MKRKEKDIKEIKRKWKTEKEKSINKREQNIQRKEDSHETMRKEAKKRKQYQRYKQRIREN